MNPIVSLIFAVLLTIASLIYAMGQTLPEAALPAGQGTITGGEMKDYSSLIKGIFDPISDQVNLSAEQQFRIVAIMTSEWDAANPLTQKFNEVDQQLFNISFADSIDEARVRELSAQEGRILAELIAIKVRMKVRIYQILTPTQKTLVTEQFLKIKGQENVIGQSLY